MKAFTSPTPQDLGKSLQPLFHNALIPHEEYGYDQLQAGKLALNTDMLGFLGDFEDANGQGLERKRKDEQPTSFMIRHLIDEGVSHNDSMAAWDLPYATFYLSPL